MERESNKTPKNYNTCKYRIYVLSFGRSQFVTICNLEVITLRATDRKYRKYLQQEKKCKYLLIKRIGDDQLEHVKVNDKFTVKEIFSTLEGIFERTSISGWILLRKKLINMKYDEKDDITNHYICWRMTKQRELKCIGARQDGMDIVCQLLVTLPKSYNPLVTALEIMYPKMLTLEYVKRRLIAMNTTVVICL